MKSGGLHGVGACKDGTIDTMGKPWSACWFAFSPHSGCDWVYGETDKVKAYWESLTCSFDFQWFVYESESALMQSMKEMEAESVDFPYHTFYPVENCALGDEPDIQNSRKPSSQEGVGAGIKEENNAG